MPKERGKEGSYGVGCFLLTVFWAFEFNVELIHCIVFHSDFKIAHHQFHNIGFFPLVWRRHLRKTKFGFSFATKNCWWVLNLIVKCKEFEWCTLDRRKENLFSLNVQWFLIIANSWQPSRFELIKFERTFLMMIVKRFFYELLFVSFVHEDANFPFLFSHPMTLQAFISNKFMLAAETKRKKTLFTVLWWNRKKKGKQIKEQSEVALLLVPSFAFSIVY